MADNSPMCYICIPLASVIDVSLEIKQRCVFIFIFVKKKIIANISRRTLQYKSLCRELVNYLVEWEGSQVNTVFQQAFNANFCLLSLTIRCCRQDFIHNSLSIFVKKERLSIITAQKPVHRFKSKMI